MRACAVLHRSAVQVQGMEYLHSKGVVHLNLKTGNLLVGFAEKQPACKVRACVTGADRGRRRARIRAAASTMPRRRASNNGRAGRGIPAAPKGLLL